MDCGWMRLVRPMMAGLTMAAVAAVATAQPGPANGPQNQNWQPNGGIAGNNTAPAVAPSPRSLAPGFTFRPKASRLLVVQSDMELFSISAGGVSEPRADWTDLAQKNFQSAMAQDSRRKLLGDQATALQEKDLDELAELNALHGAVAQSVFLHHAWGGAQALPTKNDKLDWSIGDAVRPLKDKTGVDYALFTWVRDSYASPERKAAMVAMAMLGIGIVGGTQIGYASLVDLNTGRIVWFNHVARASGDLREVESARETVDALLKGFPALQ